MVCKAPWRIKKRDGFYSLLSIRFGKFYILVAGTIMKLASSLIKYKSSALLSGPPPIRVYVAESLLGTEVKKKVYGGLGSQHITLQLSNGLVLIEYTSLTHATKLSPFPVLSRTI